MKKLIVVIRLAALSVALSLASRSAVAAPTAKQPEVDPAHAEKMKAGLELFKSDVRPVLIRACIDCHGGDEVQSGLDLATRKGLLRGGSKGPAVVAGKSLDSNMLRFISHREEPKMPEGGDKLSAKSIDAIARWIDLGAPYDAPLVVNPRDPDSWTTTTVPAKSREFWAFQPLARVTPPGMDNRLPTQGSGHGTPTASQKLKNEAWPRNPIDRFVLDKLEEKGLMPSRPATRRQLIRRAYFDLIGLPPTPEAIEQFIADADPNAYDKLIDKLLDSSHYGERWGRHWLDTARFAESHGFEQDYDRPHAYHYRDFVIKALNQDMPFDQFVRWQLAGDEFEPDNPLAMMATGFLGAGVFPTQITANEVERTRYDALDDMAATTSTAMLGLSVGCARCHDHKFDPIPQADYYRFLSTFTTTVRSNQKLNLDPAPYLAAKAEWEESHKPPAAALFAFERDELPARFAKWLNTHSAEARDVPPQALAALVTPIDKRSVEQTTAILHWYRTLDPHWVALNAPVQAHLAKQPQPTLTEVMVCSEGVAPIRHHTQGDDFFKETFFLKRGDNDQKMGQAAPGFLQVLMTAPDKEKHWQIAPPRGASTSFRRRAMANWMTDTEHGAGHLLARVIVNRLWQHHFGTGIVSTPNDFGLQGTKPSHPELLDWLAAELIRNDWRLKPLHRLMMNSNSYLQSGKPDSANNTQLDPDNILLWRRVPRRLEAEIIRDNMLFVSNTLDAKMFGPGSLDESHKRRSIYFMIKRSKLIPMMQLFDQPEPLVSVGDRPRTTIAPQALMFMNNPQVRMYAHNFAKRLLPAFERSPRDAIQLGYTIAIGRAPDDGEIQDLIEFLSAQQASYESASAKHATDPKHKAVVKTDARELALADFCQVLFGLNEFVYVE